MSIFEWFHKRKPTTRPIALAAKEMLDKMPDAEFFELRDNINQKIRKIKPIEGIPMPAITIQTKQDIIVQIENIERIADMVAATKERTNYGKNL